MSIQTQIDRLASAKAAIKTAIEGKGVTVPADTLLSGMAALIDSIETGDASGMNIACGEITNTSIGGLVAFNVMSIDDWTSQYGNFPSTFWGAIWAASPGEITASYKFLYKIGADINGSSIRSTITTTSNVRESNNSVAQVNKNKNSIQILGDSQTGGKFDSGMAYKWVILW